MLSGSLCLSLIFTAIGPVLSAIAAAFGGGTGAVWIAQLMMTLPDIGMIVGSPIAGMLVERWGSRNLLLVSLALFGLTGTAGLYVNDPQLLLATRFLLGCSGAAVATSSTALIGAQFEGEQRTRMLGYLIATGSIGGFVSVLLAGQIAAIGGWRAPFSLYGVAFLCLVVAVPCISAAGDRTRVPRKKGFSVEEVKSLAALWPLYAWLIGLYVAAYMAAVQLSFLLAADGITNPRVQSWVIAPNSAGSAVAGIACGWIRPRIGIKWTFVLIIGFMCAGITLMALGKSPVMLGLGSGLSGAGSGMLFAHLSSLILERAPLNVRGRAIGLFYTGSFLAAFINPLVVTPIRLAIGIHGAFLTVGIVLGAVGIVLAVRKEKVAAAAI